ncbi:MAG: nicotinate-nucleotide--dimethylbenzimidazole phosphoribosyltransferase [Rhizobacter sp.]
MPVSRSLIAPTANPLLERALRDKLGRRSETTGQLGELEPLAIRLGLVQNSLKPRFRAPQIALFASDHGLAVDGVDESGGLPTARLVQGLLASQLPVSVFARIQSMDLHVVDCGVAETLAPHPRLMARKIAHGTRNCRVNMAMTLDQAHAAIRAGMEISDSMTGNLIACAGIGVGSHQSAALVLSALSNEPVHNLVATPNLSPESDTRLMMVLQAAQSRHRELTDPVEVLAAYGGFEIAMMVGVMLVASSKRRLIMVDGMAACAALMVAARIAPTVTDYSIFSRSHGHPGLTAALGLFNAQALLELGMESTDGTGATLAFPLLLSSAALLTEVAEGEDAGPSQPADMPASTPGNL